MELIGTITRLQIQESSLKVGASPRRFDPAPLRVAPLLEITPAGVVGRDEAGQRLIDVHNARHPASKNRAGQNGVSLGFTAHYAAMRSRFGDHLGDGIAGENILIETPRPIPLTALERGVIVENASGERLALHRVGVAAPCVEFTRFALRIPDDETPDATVQEALQFLHHGMRGFYASFAGAFGTIAIGDRVFFA